MHPEEHSEPAISSEIPRPHERVIPPVNLDVALREWVHRYHHPEGQLPEDLILLFRGVGTENEGRTRVGVWWSESPRQAASYEYRAARGKGTLYVAEATRAELEAFRRLSESDDPWIHQFNDNDPANARPLTAEELETLSITFTSS